MSPVVSAMGGATRRSRERGRVVDSVAEPYEDHVGADDLAAGGRSRVSRYERRVDHRTDAERCVRAVHDADRGERRGPDDP